jgi:hypothetical protein
MTPPFRERAVAALIAVLAAACCVVTASAAHDLDRRTELRQRQLDCLLAPESRAGGAGALPELDGLFPGLQVMREPDSCGGQLRLLPGRRSGEGT